MENQINKKLRCKICGCLISASFVVSYLLCPKCSVQIDDCVVNSEKYPDMIQAKYSDRGFEDSLLLLDVNGSSVTVSASASGLGIKSIYGEVI